MQRRPIDAHEAAALNRELVFAALGAENVISRAGLARSTGLSKATVSQIIDQFRRDGLIEIVGPGPSVKGRRPTLLRLDPQSRFVVGVQLEATSCSAVLADLHGQPVRKLSTAMPLASAEDALAAAADLIQQLRAGLPAGKLLGIGLGVPGLVDSARGIIRSAANLGWRDVPAGPAIAARTGIPTVLINRAKAAAVGEAWCGAGKGVDDLVCIYVSTGISAGIVLRGDLYRGAFMSEGEIGHHTMLPDGPLCPCGNRGCLQMFASGPAILTRLLERLRADPMLRTGSLADDEPDALTFELLAQAAAEGNTAVTDVLDSAADYLGIAVANLVNTLDPPLVILGGPVIDALPMLVPRVEAVIRRRALWVSAASVRVAASQLGQDAVALGAAAFLLRHISVIESGTGNGATLKKVQTVVLPEQGPQEQGPVLVPDLIGRGIL
jgi:glucokinase-like ROK family protein